MASDVATDRFRTQRLRRTFLALLGILLFELVCWSALRMELYDSLGFGLYLWIAVLLGSVASLAIVGSTLALVIRRGWFTLREFMIAMLVLGALCGVAGHRYNEKRHQREATQHLLARGARIILEGDSQRKDEPGLERLLGRDWFHGVVTVQASDLTEEDMGFFVALRELETLMLQGAADNHLAPLAHVPSLTSLYLNDPPAVGLGVGLPLGSPSSRLGFTGSSLKHLQNHPSLERLGLFNEQMSENELVYLSGIPLLTDLHIYAALSDIGMRHLGHCKRLTTLTLNQADCGFEHLANLYHLETLTLGRSADATVDLAGLEQCPQLKHLTIYNGSFSDEDFSRLAQCPNLTYLSIRLTRFSDTAIEALTKSPSLVALHLDGGVSNAALVHLVGMANLADLAIHSTEKQPIDDMGLQRLASIPNLKSLRLAFTTLTDEGLNCVESMPNLKVLKFHAPHVSPQRRVALKEKLPNLEL